MIFCRKPPLLRLIWQGRFHQPNFPTKTVVLPVTKTAKPVLLAFPKGAGVDTYAPHPLALARVAFSGSSGFGSIGACRWPVSRPARFFGEDGNTVTRGGAAR